MTDGKWRMTDGKISNPKSKTHKPIPTDLRRHRANTDRNLLIGFFVVLLMAGGGLILYFYGGLAMGAGLLCFIGAALLVAVVFLILFGLGWLGDWLDSREG